MSSDRVCPTCGQTLPTKRRRVCGACNQPIGSHDKYFFDGSVVKHRDCSNPRGYPEAPAAELPLLDRRVEAELQIAGSLDEAERRILGEPTA